MRFAAALVATLGLGHGALVLAQPKLPLTTSSRWILDGTGKRVKFTCVNWAAHGETNTPEGLHKATIDFIADFIHKSGFNCVRLTYSIDHALQPKVTVKDSFTAAAKSANVSLETMTHLYDQIVCTNKITDTTTTQDLFAAVIKALWQRGVMTLLDNHVSKAQWCCNLADGNGWWDEAPHYVADNSRYFKTQEWLRGLEAMATWAKTQPGVSAMSLRNELRPTPVLQDLDGTHDSWFRFVGQGAERVHAANPDVLIVIGGTQSAQDLNFLKRRDLDRTRFPARLVWEMHAYTFSVTYRIVNPLGTCAGYQAAWGHFDAFVLEEAKPYTAPLIVSEFGVGIEGGDVQGLNKEDADFMKCLTGWMKGNDVDWVVWALQGNYYTREGKTEFDEPWGLLNKDWSGPRNPSYLSTYFTDILKTTQGPGH